jgi:hypothetical protein
MEWPAAADFNDPSLRIDEMQPSDNRDQPRGRWTSVMTDVHFWVPVAVLIGGLILLKSIH